MSIQGELEGEVTPQVIADSAAQAKAGGKACTAQIWKWRKAFWVCSFARPGSRLIERKGYTLPYTLDCTDKPCLEPSNQPTKQTNKQKGVGEMAQYIKALAATP